jgi:hypothetical protein
VGDGSRGPLRSASRARASVANGFAAEPSFASFPLAATWIVAAAASDVIDAMRTIDKAVTAIRYRRMSECTLAVPPSATRVAHRAPGRPQSRKRSYDNPENLSSNLKRQQGRRARLVEQSRTTDP